MKKIKINFADFWSDFDKENNYFTKILKEKYDIEISDSPDYLFYSCFGMDYLNYDCIRIFFTGENIRPDFNLCDYAIGFDWLDFGDRYLRFPLYILYIEDFKRAIQKHKNAEELLINKKKFCDFIYSNNEADPTRINFLKLLNNYKTVDSGGRLLNNLGYIVEDKLSFQKEHKFSLAFENSSTIGYTTEKIVQAFAAGSIPIYWGNPCIHKEFNTKAFVNCHQYKNFDEVISRIVEIDEDDELYMKIISEPLFEGEDLPKSLSKEYLLEFLDNIFSQDLLQAVRRNKCFHGKQYEDKIKLLKEMRSNMLFKGLYYIKKSLRK